MMRIPPDDGYPDSPLIGPGGHLPLAYDPTDDVETPDAQKLFPTEGVGVLARLYGERYPAGFAEPTMLEEGYRRVNPGSTPERIRYFDVQRCEMIAEGQITAAGTGFELTRVHLQKFGLGAIERIVTPFESVTALDGAGEPVFDWGPVGERACQFPLQHPDPAAGMLAIEFRLVVTGIPDNSSQSTAGLPALQVGVPVDQIRPDNLIPPWADMRYGGQTLSDQLKYLVGDDVIVSLVLILRGLPDRWRVHATGRLAGHWISAGPSGAAHHDAIRRF